MIAMHGIVQHFSEGYLEKLGVDINDTRLHKYYVGAIRDLRQGDNELAYPFLIGHLFSFIGEQCGKTFND